MELGKLESRSGVSSKKRIVGKCCLIEKIEERKRRDTVPRIYMGMEMRSMRKCSIEGEVKRNENQE
ncbi:hypothetical protein Fmac_005875 [Flemingia macrophylla]|uniref:Uncharacterized protein n=1 Tax=Flemingia macrophylla TaxID=520843 RepID=A0ABD1N948_9FABA